MIFGRRKPGFTREEELKDNEIPSEYSKVQEDAEFQKAEENEPKDLLDALVEMDEVATQEVSKEEVVPEEEPEKSMAEHMGDFIRVNTMNENLLARKNLLSEEPELDQYLEELKSSEEYQDIVSVQGHKDTYYYSDDYMSHNYAMITSLIIEKDLLVTVASMIRFNSKLYPAPTPLTYFMNPPYNMTKSQLERVRSMLKNHKEYEDIQEVTTGNDKLYFHSTQTMSAKYALALAEDAEQGEYGYR